MSSMNNLSQDGELRYILQWFNEWSELQRDDFVPVLVDYLTATAPTTAEEVNSNSVYMNGLVHAVNNTGVHDRPMSLFQCRIKLFRQWSIKWPQDFKQKLQQSITEIDTKVGEKILNELKTETGVNGNSFAKAQTNGISSHASSDDDDDDHEQHVENVAANNSENDMNNASTVMLAAQSIVDSTETVLNADTRVVSQVPNNESFAPVADDIRPDNNTNSSGGEMAITIMAENSNSSEPAEPVLMPITPQEHVAATAIPI